MAPLAALRYKGRMLVRRILPLAPALILALAGCGDDPPKAEARFDTLNVGLAGSFVPNEDARRAVIPGELAALESDVVCLQEVWTQADKDAIEAAIGGTFPHIVSFTHDLDTEIDDATDQNGEVPPAPTMPPCGTAELEGFLDAAITCVADNCSTIPGSEEGMTTSTDCAQSNCLSAVTDLLVGGPENQRCYGCLASSLPVETLADMRTLCTTEVNAGLAFRGQSGVMIASKHPLTEADDFVMPGTWNRRIVAAATVTLPDDVEVDVYCNHLTPIFNNVAFPYTGQYGEDRTGAPGWAAEQELQAQKLAAYVASRSGDRPAVILGDMNAGRAIEGTDLENEGIATMDVLEANFELAMPDEPRATFTPDNGNNVEDTDNVWIDHIWLYGSLTATDVEVTFEEDLVPLDDGSMVPLSDHYGMKALIQVR